MIKVYASKRAPEGWTASCFACRKDAEIIIAAYAKGFDDQEHTLQLCVKCARQLQGKLGKEGE